MGEVCQVIFVNEFLWDVGKFDSDIFRVVKGRAEVEVFYIKAGEACIWCGDDTVDEEFGQLEGSGFGAVVSWVADAIASNCDVRPVWVLLLWSDFTDNACVGDITVSVGGNVM